MSNKKNILIIAFLSLNYLLFSQDGIEKQLNIEISENLYPQVLSYENSSYLLFTNRKSNLELAKLDSSNTVIFRKEYNSVGDREGHLRFVEYNGKFLVITTFFHYIGYNHERRSRVLLLDNLGNLEWDSVLETEAFDVRGYKDKIFIIGKLHSHGNIIPTIIEYDLKGNHISTNKITKGQAANCIRIPHSARMIQIQDSILTLSLPYCNGYLHSLHNLIRLNLKTYHINEIFHKSPMGSSYVLNKDTILYLTSDSDKKKLNEYRMPTPIYNIVGRKLYEEFDTFMIASDFLKGQYMNSNFIHNRNNITVLGLDNQDFLFYVINGLKVNEYIFPYKKLKLRLFDFTINSDNHVTIFYGKDIQGDYNIYVKDLWFNKSENQIKTE